MADLDVAVRLKFFTDGEGKLKAAAKDLAAFGKSVNQLSGRATGRFGNDLNKAWHASAKLGGSLDKSAKAAGKTATAMRAIGQTQGLDRARTSVDRLTKSTNALASAERKVRATAVVGSGRGGALAAGALGGAVASRRKAAMREGLAEAASRVSPGAGYLIGAGGAVALGAAVGGTVATVGAAMAYGTKQAIDFEKAMADVQKKVDLDPGATWIDAERLINKNARAFGISRTDMAGLAATAGQAGIAYKDLGKFMGVAAKAASAWDMSPSETSEVLARIKAQTLWSIPQLEEFADQVNAIADAGATSERNVVEMFNRSAAAAKAANVPLKTTLAVTAALSSTGMQEEVATTWWNAFVSNLGTTAGGAGGPKGKKKGKQKAKAAEDGWRMLGLTGDDVRQGMKTDATKTIIDVLDRLEKHPDKANVAVKIWGRQWWDETARAGQALPEIIKNLELIQSGRWKNSLDKSTDIDMATTAKHLEKVSVLVSEIGDRFMRWALPPINAGIDQWMESLDRRQRAADERAAVKPVGRSITDFEKAHGLDRPIRNPGPPTFTRIEGATPHVATTTANGKPMLDLSQFGPAAEKAVGESSDLYDALQKLNTTVNPQVNTAVIGQLNAVEAAAQRAAGAMRALSTFGAPGAVRVNPTITGAPRGGGSSGGGGSAPATPGKQSSLGRGGGVQIATAHFHGVKDARAMHRQLAALDRRIRSARDNALHDVG